ncbi:MAG: CopG family antitoxin [Cyanobacteria bacterium J06623_4]
MSVRKTSHDPIPEEFETYEEFSNFWDTHDTTDYPDAFENVQVEDVDIRSRRFEVEVEADIMSVLSKIANQQGVAVQQLVNRLLRDTLNNAA